MNFKKLTIWAFASILTFNSCRNDDSPSAPKGAYENGILMANEGNFTKPEASVSYISNDLSKIENGIYSSANNKELLGTTLQAINFKNDNAYFVLNGSNKVVIANRYTMKKQGEFSTNLTNPRYIAFANDYIYVTNDTFMGEKNVSIFKASDNSFVKKIVFDTPSEKVVEFGNNIFVQNASFGNGNTISLIQTSDNTLKTTLTLPNGNLQNMIKEDNHLYAFSSDEATSYIYQISNTANIVRTISLKGFPSISKFSVSKGSFYFANDKGIYAMPINSNTIPSSPIISKGISSWDSYYGFDVMDGKIFISNANGFTADSKVSVYSTNGIFLKEFTTGVGTNGFYKN